MNPLGLILVVATAAFPALQLFALQDVGDPIALFSQYLGMAALILMAWTQVWATRLPGLETIFGGLDRIYNLHKWAGITAMLAMLLHSLIDADLPGPGGGPLNGIAESLGEVSLYGLLFLSAISIATFIPYRLWKWTHKAMGALFAAGALHFCFIAKPFAMSDPSGWYTGAFCVAGLAAYAWTLLPDGWRPAKRYSIVTLEKTGGATAVTLQPIGRGLKPYPGQFGIVRFVGSQKAEPHPFTFSSIAANGDVRVTVKPLGDFTRTIETSLRVGQEVHLQGPFGRFRMPPRKRQVWIAGGIGITPFLAWAQSLQADAPNVDLFYCIKSRDQAPHLDEITTLAADKPNLTLHVIVSSHGQRLSADLIANLLGADLKPAHVSFCGPLPMRRSLQKGLSVYGGGPRQFHFEEFEFRSGLGLMRLVKRMADLFIRLPAAPNWTSWLPFRDARATSRQR